MPVCPCLSSSSQLGLMSSCPWPVCLLYQDLSHPSSTVWTFSLSHLVPSQSSFNLSRASNARDSREFLAGLQTPRNDFAVSSEIQIHQQSESHRRHQFFPMSGSPSAPSVLVKGPKSPKPRPRGLVGGHQLGLSSILIDRPRAPLGPFSARPCLRYFVLGRPIQAFRLSPLPGSSASSLTRQTVLMARPGRSGQG